MSILTQTHTYTCTHSTLLAIHQLRAGVPTPRLSVRNPQVEYVPILCLSCRRDSIPLTFEAAGQLPSSADNERADNDDHIEDKDTHVVWSVRSEEAAEGARRRAENRSARVINGYLLCKQGFGPVVYAPQQALTAPSEAATADEVQVPETEAATSSSLPALSIGGTTPIARPEPPNTAELERDHVELGAYTVNADPPTPWMPPRKTLTTRPRALPKSKWAAKKERVCENFAAFGERVRKVFRW